MGEAAKIDAYWHFWHDIFNLIALPLICMANVHFLYVNDSHSAYLLNFFAFVVYLVLDTFWVIVVPKCVASPTTILAHHAITLLGWSLPIIFPSSGLEAWCSKGLLVEFNTFLLIARRNLLPSTIINFAFYFTWITLRLIFYPFQGYLFFTQRFIVNQDRGAWGFLLLMCALNMLNLQWSYNLFFKLNKHDTPSKGL